MKKNNSHSYLQKKTRELVDLLCVVTTVLLFYLAFPSGGIGLLAWVALVPLFITLNDTTGRYAFILGLTTATLGWFCSIWWTIDGIAQITSSPSNLVIPIIFLFCAFSALPYALGTYVYVTFKWNRSIFGALKAAAFFTILVNYIPHILPGNMAHALYLSPLHIQIADIGGVPIVFFIIHAVNFLIARACIEAFKNRIKSINYISVAAGLFISNILYGVVATHLIDSKVGNAHKALNIAMVQPNIDTDFRTREDWASVRYSIGSASSKLLLGAEEFDLLVFPEVPVPISYEYFQGDAAFFDRLTNSKPMLVTAIEPFNQKMINEEGYFNTVELIENSKVTQRYRKQKLLPVGEYLPFEKQIPWIRKIFPYAPNYKAGNSSLILPLTIKDNELNIIPLICYEAVFTDLVGSGVSMGGNVFVNTVNDAWFSNTAGVNVHLALSLFRTVEYRKPMIRVTNAGFSIVINTQGEMIENSQIATNEIGVSVTSVTIPKTESFYQQFPNLVKYILILFVFISLTFDWKDRIQKVKSK